jgi:hypothetical protein
MIEAMIDIETLDVKPSSVVLSIGAQFFTQELGPEGFASFYTVLELQEQLEVGRTVSASTLEWWMRQDPRSRDAAFLATNYGPGKASVVTALYELRAYLSGADVIWAKPPSFDCVILQSLGEAFGVEMLEGFRDWRDVRTICAEAELPKDWRPDFMPAGVPHDPVYDACYQIHMVCEARRRLRSVF